MVGRLLEGFDQRRCAHGGFRESSDHGQETLIELVERVWFEGVRGQDPDHFPRWAGRFAARLEDSGTDPLYAEAGCLLGGFVEADAVRVGPKKKPTPTARTQIS